MGCVPRLHVGVGGGTYFYTFPLTPLTLHSRLVSMHTVLKEPKAVALQKQNPHDQLSHGGVYEAIGSVLAIPRVIGGTSATEFSSRLQSGQSFELKLRATVVDSQAFGRYMRGCRHLHSPNHFGRHNEINIRSRRVLAQQFEKLLTVGSSQNVTHSEGAVTFQFVDTVQNRFAPLRNGHLLPNGHGALFMVPSNYLRNQNVSGLGLLLRGLGLGRHGVSFSLFFVSHLGYENEFRHFSFFRQVKIKKQCKSHTTPYILLRNPKKGMFV